MKKLSNYTDAELYAELDRRHKSKIVEDAIKEGVVLSDIVPRIIMYSENGEPLDSENYSPQYQFDYRYKGELYEVYYELPEVDDKGENLKDWIENIIRLDLTDLDESSYESCVSPLETFTIFKNRGFDVSNLRNNLDDIKIIIDTMDNSGEAESIVFCKNIIDTEYEDSYEIKTKEEAIKFVQDNFLLKASPVWVREVAKQLKPKMKIEFIDESL